jgi:hypothetical protein
MVLKGQASGAIDLKSATPPELRSIRLCDESDRPSHFAA